MSRARSNVVYSLPDDEDNTLGNLTVESRATRMAKPKTCIRCGHSGITSDFGDYGLVCPECHENPNFQDMLCPRCKCVGLHTRSGWDCRKCGHLYHKCQDGVVRSITEKVNGVCCSVCGDATWVNKK